MQDCQLNGQIKVSKKMTPFSVEKVVGSVLESKKAFHIGQVLIKIYGL